jgi:hypothetical protein
VRARDNMNRWCSIKKSGASNDSRHTFFPIYDYTKAQVIQELRDAGWKLGVEYEIFGRSFDGLDWRFMKPLKETFPADYARVLELFPLVELEIKRIEYREEYYAAQNKFRTHRYAVLEQNETDADTEEEDYEPRGGDPADPGAGSGG